MRESHRVPRPRHPDGLEHAAVSELLHHAHPRHLVGLGVVVRLYAPDVVRPRIPLHTTRTGSKQQNDFNSRGKEKNKDGEKKKKEIKKKNAMPNVCMLTCVQVVPDPKREKVARPLLLMHAGGGVGWSLARIREHTQTQASTPSVLIFFPHRPFAVSL